MSQRFVLVSVAFWAIQVPTTNALDEGSIKQLLQRHLVGSERALADVQRFTESRVRMMPAVESRAEWEKLATQIRRDVLQNVVFRGEAARWRDAETHVEWLDAIAGGTGYRIRKLRYEALPELWIPALLYEPSELQGKVPVVLNVNGHDQADGKAANYKQIRCINQARRGMLALNVEWLGMGQLNAPGYSHGAMNQLDLCGTSGLAPFYLSMRRGLDLLLAHENADPQRVAVAGLSGGGWQTIFISSLDTRVTLANPVAGYSSFITRARQFKDLGDSEQTPNDLAVYADYTHLTALLAPRPALLTYNKTDNCCFESTTALPPLLSAARPVYELYGQPHRLRAHVNVDPGTHNFLQENREALYRLLGDHFYAGDESFAAGEMACDDEVRTKDELHVSTPADNATFNSLAIALSKSLPRDSNLPTERIPASDWQERGRKELNELIRSNLDNYDCQAEQQDSFTRDGVRITYWRVRISGNWTVPVTEFDPPDATSTALVINDDGRMTCAAIVNRLVSDRKRVLAVDPFYFGESAVSQKDHLFALLVTAVGRRPVGVQANQLASLARWSRSTFPAQPVTLMAHGPRTSTIALVAAGIEPTAIAGVDLNASLGSLKQVIEKNQLVNQTPEVFCFGLLERFDILQLAALVAPRPLTFHQPDDRVKEELKSLAGWYKTLGVDHEPLRRE